ncbi:MFS transporter [Nocardioides sp. CER19]|uniref:MFS transporter n=1 Tax=Nocardioides sp. CER19 TaxID=3038538 RepID=UPI0024477603|nr:MFS transporter [Nocardioides sp. CER19]MDH2413043.1 MFS transporter [Nocardioides sp. CER19]
MTVTIGYGVLYYAFTVLAPAISKDTGWSHTAVVAAFSVGSVVGGVAGIPVGRALQEHGPRAVMTLGSLSGAVAVAVVALAPTLPVFILGWVLAGLASTGLFYPPAFATVTEWFGQRRVQAVTTLTLVAGFASTIFAPLTSALDGAVGWRRTYLLLGIVLLATLPAHAVALKHPWTGSTRATSARSSADRGVVTSRPFILLTAAGTLTSLAMYASLVNLVPLLTSRGLSTGLAAWALGIGGAGQVAGRLAYPALSRRMAPTARAAAVIGLLSATLVALAVVPGPAGLLVAIAVVSGAARGLFTLVGATLVTDHWGPKRYAALSGVYNAPVSIAAALAPALGAGLAAATGGYGALFLILAGLSVAAVALAVLSSRPGTREPVSEARAA